MGKGAALGVALCTEATVELLEETRDLEVIIQDEPQEDTKLAKEVLKVVLKRYGRENLGARARTVSNIPIAKGLKSSSAAANAISLATVAALGVEAHDEEVVKMGVEASLKAGVTITGAYDDACASYFGGIVVTDNLARKILVRDTAPEDLKVLIYAPHSKTYTSSVDKETIGKLSPLVEEAFRLAQGKDFWKAMTMNGLIYSMALEESSKPVLGALRMGALGAGLSGTGPAIAAICDEDSLVKVKEAWSGLPGRVIETQASNRRAEVKRG